MDHRSRSGDSSRNTGQGHGKGGLEKGHGKSGLKQSQDMDPQRQAHHARIQEEMASGLKLGWQESRGRASKWARKDLRNSDPAVHARRQAYLQGQRPETRPAPERMREGSQGGTKSMPSQRKICRRRESFTGIKKISRTRSISRKGSSRPGTRPPRGLEKGLSCRRRKRRKTRNLMRKTALAQSQWLPRPQRGLKERRPERRPTAST